MVHVWPCSGNELNRRLGGLELNKQNAEQVVRPILTRLHCPKVGGLRSEFLVTPEIAVLVADE
jgi:hypothetical protein